jgi:Ser/Thr protein kinase RdoA (MazF antagonist)
MIGADLERDYGITPGTIEAHSGGFESECWIVDGAWFVKVWKPGRRPQRLELLDQLQDAGLPVVVALRTRDGACHATTAGRDYAVFPYVDGRLATPDDWAATADIMKQVHAATGVELPVTTVDEPWIDDLRNRLDHPWIRDRAHTVRAYADRLEAVIGRARATEVAHVVCHRDLQGANLLLGGGRVVAILDWDWALSAPREHDLWVAADMGRTIPFLDRYGARDLDITHLEYAPLARALRDLAARVTEGVDRPGVETWGFDRLGRLDRDLDVLRPYCR